MRPATRPTAQSGLLGCWPGHPGVAAGDVLSGTPPVAIPLLPQLAFLCLPHGPMKHGAAVPRADEEKWSEFPRHNGAHAQQQRTATPNTLKVRCTHLTRPRMSCWRPALSSCSSSRRRFSASPRVLQRGRQERRWTR
jgi:hypothetical protein